MRRFLLLLLVLPLLAGACGDDATEDTPDPPATTLPAGTRDDPFKKTSEAVFSDVKINGQTVAFE